MEKRSLHLACWNINEFKVKGFNKYSDPEFINEISNKDIVCLLETHCLLQDSLALPNFRNVHLNRSKN
jgi:exonuclease III